MELPAPDSLSRLVCTGCDRSFPSTDAEAMLAAIKGPCPDCGGSFELARPDADSPKTSTQLSEG